MKTRYSLIILIVFFNSIVTAQAIKEDQIYLADPTVFEDAGTYYLYGTKGDPKIEGEGFLVYTSEDLIKWEGPAGVNSGFALKKGEAFGDKGFWAPQIFKRDGKYYMAYTANEQIAIAESDSPLGAFTNNGEALQAPVKQIDPFIFFDRGKAYLYHVRLQDGNRIFVAEMNTDLQSNKEETLTECLYAEKPWENTENVDWTVSEGPTVLKHNGLYYLIYSANDFRNQDYAIGYATSKSPLGPWKKSEKNPIISSQNIGMAGTGHGDLFYNSSGKMLYVFHTHFSEAKVSPRKTGLVELKFEGKELQIVPGSFRLIKTSN